MVLNWKARLFRFLNGFLFSIQKPCFFTGAPWVGMACLFVLYIYIKPSINASNRSIFRSIIHLNIKLCKKNRTKTTNCLWEYIQHNSWRKNTTPRPRPWARFCDHERDSVIAIRGIRDNELGRCNKRGWKRVKRGWNRGEAWELTWAEKKLRNVEHLNIRKWYQEEPRFVILICSSLLEHPHCSIMWYKQYINWWHCYHCTGQT